MDCALKNPKKILVRMPNWVGDCVMAAPVLRALKRSWPQAKLTAMCQAATAPLFQFDPHLDELFSFQKPNGWLHRRRFRDVVGTIRHGEYDLGILLTNSLSSALWFWRGGVKSIVGYTSPLRAPFLTLGVPYPKEGESIHQTLVYQKLLEPLGIPPSEEKPLLYLREKERRDAKKRLRQYRFPEGARLIGINPGAAFGSAKCWPPERFEQLTERLLEDPKVCLLYFGDEAGAPLVSRICSNFSDRVVNLAGKTTLRELMALTAECDLFLTNDSGPMHIASALEVPLVALFGSTNPKKTGPLDKKGLCVKKETACSPCYLRFCPIDFRCMKQISVDEVFEKLHQLLQACPSKN